MYITIRDPYCQPLWPHLFQFQVIFSVFLCQMFLCLFVKPISQDILKEFLKIWHKYWLGRRLRFGDWDSRSKSCKKIWGYNSWSHKGFIWKSWKHFTQFIYPSNEDKWIIYIHSKIKCIFFLPFNQKYNCSPLTGQSM